MERKKERERKGKKKGRKALWGYEWVMDFWSNCEAPIFLLCQNRKSEVIMTLHRQHGITQFMVYFQTVLVNY